MKIIEDSKLLISAIILIGMGLTSFLSYYLFQKTKQEEKSRFKHEVSVILQHIDNKMNQYEGALIQTRAFFLSAEVVTRDEFKEYFESTHLLERHPGIESSGYIEKIAFENDYSYPVIFLEPQTPENEKAIGYDMFSNPLSRKTMEEARDKGEAILGYEDKDLSKTNFNLYLPLYEQGAKLDTAEQRQASLKGFIFIPFHSNDLFSAIFAKYSPDISFEIFKGVKASPEAKIFSYGLDEEIENQGAIQSVENILLGGRTFTIKFQSPPEFHKNTSYLSIIIAIVVGATTTALLLWIYLLTRKQFLIITKSREKSELEGRRLNQATMELQYQANLNRTITDNATSSLFMIDKKGYPTFMNPAAEKLTGYNLEDIQERPLSRTLLLEDGAEFDFKHKQNQEEIFLDKSGNPLIVSYSLSPIEVNGEISGAVLEFKDIGEEKARQNEIHSEKQKFETIFLDSSAAMALLRGPDLIFEKVNPKYQETMCREDLIGKPFEEVHPELVQQPFYSLMKDVFKTGNPFIGKEMMAELCRTPEGKPEVTYFDITYSRINDGKGNPYGIYIHAVDITEKVSIRKIIEETEERLGLALDSAQMGTWELNLETNELVCSPRSVELFGFEDGEQFNMASAFEKIHPEDRERVRLATAEATDPSKNGDYQIEYRVTQRDGNLKWLSLSGKAYFSHIPGGSKVTRFSGVVFDFTDKKTFEEKLIHAVHARDEFLSVASHELKTPLTSLSLQAEIYRRDTIRNKIHLYTPEKLEKMVSLILKQVTRLTRLVDDMLDASRTLTGRLAINLEEFDLCDLIEEVLDRMSTHFTSVSLPKPAFQRCENSSGHWDRFRLEQVLTNLLTNAVRYGKGSEIFIAAESVENSIKIAIKDSGMGIAPEAKEKIFDRFERSISANEVSGLGLGLFISKQIVTDHGGKIWVESELGEGSTFYVQLPRYQDQQTEKSIS
jgi:PAS domain S-box-containing protein